MIYSKFVFWWDYIIIGYMVVIWLHGRIATMGIPYSLSFLWVFDFIPYS